MRGKTTTRAARSELTSKGERRVSEILAAGSAIIVEHGFRAVSKRSVAKRLNISDGNVSYYFPSKESLWLAVIDHELDEYYRRHHAESELPNEDAQASFDDFVSGWIDEYQDPMVRIFFSQIITVAEVNPSIAAKRDEIYEAFVDSMLRSARRLVPDVAAPELERRVLTAMAVLEGLHAISAFRPALFDDDPGYKSHIMVLVNAVIRGEVA